MLPSFLSALPILTAVALLLLQESFGAGASQYQLTHIRRPKPPMLKSGPECPTPYFPNGVAKLRQRNKMVRYTCSSGFHLVGNMYSMCEKGRWDARAPICIKAGCADLELVENGQLSYEYGRAAVMLFCSTGYQIAGSSKAYCNGTHWDRPLGSCRETGIDVQTSCDFEVMDYCGWTNEATHDFDWKRSDGVVSPKALKTGPKYDHTTMVPLAGHFMMVDSAVQLTNETARLLSPLYPANYSQSACFQFFYHMYGDQIGTLRVYVKPSTTSLDSLTAEDALFKREMNQGNMWNEGYFDMKAQTESFQIVIEASLGMKYKSDIAIDDVSLLTGTDCRTTEGQDDTVEISSIEPDDDLPAEVPVDKETFKIDSCENRCGANVSTPVLVGELFFIHCDCIEGCVDTKTCCPDYAERCVWNANAGDLPSSTTTSTTVPTTSTTQSTSTTTPATTTTTVASTTTTAAPATSTPKTTTTQRSTSTTQKTTTTTEQSTSTTPKTTTTKQTTSTTKPTTGTTTQRSTTTPRPTTTTPATTTKPPITTTSRPYNLRPRKSTETPNVVPMVRTRKPTTTSTTTPATTVEVLIVARMGFDNLASDTKPNLTHVFLFTGLAAVAFASIVLLIVLHVRRGVSVLERLKQKSMKKGYGGDTEGFEDVRFLAVDEHLDFSLPEDAEEAEESDGEGEEEKVVQKKGHKSGKKGKK